MKRLVPCPRFGLGGGLACLSAVSLSAATLLTTAPQPTRGAGGDSLAPALSAAGDTLVFLSSAPDWVAQDVNGVVMDVFVRHQDIGGVELVSVTPDGVSGNGPARFATVSPDGRWVLFVSDADNLAPNDHNGASDVFLRDLEEGVTRLVSVSATGTSSGNGASRRPSMTPDGRWITFESVADDLVAGDTNEVSDVFLRDLENGVTRWLSRPGGDPELGDLPLGACTRPVISPDGRYVAFQSSLHSQVVPGNDQVTGLFLADTATQGLQMISIRDPGLPEIVRIRIWPESAPVFSPDGQRVAFVLNSIWSRSDTGKGLYEFVPGESDFATPLSAGWQVRRMHASEFLGPLPASSSGEWLIEAHSPNDKVLQLPSAIYLASATETLRLVVTNSVQVGDPPEEIPFSQLLAVSADGDTVAFLAPPESGRPLAEARNLALFVRRLSTGETRRVPPAEGDLVLPASDVAGVALSADGNQLAWASRYAPAGRSAGQQIFLYDWDRETVEMVTPTRGGAPPYPAAGRSTFSHRCVSGDGEVVVFSSLAPNLSPPEAPDENGLSDVFVIAGQETPTVVSVNAAGDRVGNGASYDALISPDGRWVAFTSAASDLTADDDNGRTDVFLRDRETGVTVRVSTDAKTLLGVPVACRAADISSDGRWVAYEAHPLAQAEWESQALWYDHQTGRSTWINQHFQSITDTRYQQGWHPRFSPDHEWLLLRQAPTQNKDVVWAFALPSLSPTRISPSLGGFAYNFDQQDYAFGGPGKIAFAQANRGLYSLRVYDLVAGETAEADPDGVHPSLSADGTLVVFERPAGGPMRQIVLRDLEQDTEELISVDVTGTEPANGPCFAPAITPDGRFVVFASRATNLLPQAANGQTQIFCRDRQLGVTLLLSFGPDGRAADRIATAPRVSEDGRTVLFTSFAANLRGLTGPSPGDLYRVRIQAGQGPLPVLSIARADGGAPLVTWPILPDADYRVEYREALGAGDWRTLEVPWSREGNQAVLKDTTVSGAENRFYRVVRLP